ncbi:MAG: hypothetical protein QXX95_03040 [Nitrososphaerales archaeon]
MNKSNDKALIMRFLIRLFKKTFIVSFVFTFFSFLYFFYLEDYLRYYKYKKEKEKEEYYKNMILSDLKEFRERIKDREYQKLFMEKKVKLPKGCEPMVVGFSWLTMYRVDCNIKDEDGRPYGVSCVYSPLSDSVECR